MKSRLSWGMEKPELGKVAMKQGSKSRGFRSEQSNGSSNLLSIGIICRPYHGLNEPFAHQLQVLIGDFFVYFGMVTFLRTQSIMNISNNPTLIASLWNSWGKSLVPWSIFHIGEDELPSLFRRGRVSPVNWRKKPYVVHTSHIVLSIWQFLITERTLTSQFYR